MSIKIPSFRPNWFPGTTVRNNARLEFTECVFLLPVAFTDIGISMPVHKYASARPHMLILNFDVSPNSAIKFSIDITIFNSAFYYIL